jgi:nucleoside-diphosphate-sugar epimerase
MTKILVTGSHGFIGKNLVRFLKGKDIEVVEHNREVGDIQYISGHKNLFEGVDVVYHLASTVHNYHVLDAPYEDARTNVIGTISLLEGMRLYCPTAKLVFVSSFFVNDGEPKALYGATKLCAEHICKTYSRVFGIHCVIARLGNVFGPGERVDDIKKNALMRLIINAIEGKPITIYQEASIRFFLYITDVLDALWLLPWKGENMVIYDICDSKPMNFETTILLAHNVVKSKSEIVYIEPPLFHKQVGIEVAHMNPTPLRELGWEPYVDLEQGIKLVEEWYNEIRNK